MRYLLIAPLALIASLALIGGSMSQASAQQELWEITRPSSGSVRYVTHGSRVHTHEFGFAKQKGRCDADDLWLTLSSTDAQLASLRGLKIRLLVRIDDTRFEMSADLRATRSLAPQFKIAVFTGLIADRQLLDHLDKGRKMTIAVCGPPKAEQAFGGSNEAFDLAGFTEARRQAEAACNG